jgi:acetone carboxylase gamma subunit
MIPLPSPIHYELLLQLLEQQTLPIVRQDPLLLEQVKQLIICLRKAAAQQKQLEASCQQAHIDYEFRWSLNQSKSEVVATEHSPVSQP